MPAITGRFPEPGSVWYMSSAAEETKRLKASVGKLTSLFVVNVSAAVVYLYAFDSLTASGSLALPPMKLAATGGSVTFDAEGMPFETGLFLAASSTLATYTATGTADLLIKALYK